MRTLSVRIMELLEIGAVALMLSCEPSAIRNHVKPSAPPPAPLLSHFEPESWRKQQPVSGAPGQVKIPAPQVVVLKNGVTIYSIRRDWGLCRCPSS